MYQIPAKTRCRVAMIASEFEGTAWHDCRASFPAKLGSDSLVDAGNRGVDGLEFVTEPVIHGKLTRVDSGRPVKPCGGHCCQSATEPLPALVAAQLPDRDTCRPSGRSP